MEAVPFARMAACESSDVVDADRLRLNAIGRRGAAFDRPDVTESMLLPLQLAVSEWSLWRIPSSPSPSTAAARCFACLRATCKRTVRRCLISSSVACERHMATMSTESIFGWVGGGAGVQTS